MMIINATYNKFGRARGAISLNIKQFRLKLYRIK